MLQNTGVGLETVQLIPYRLKEKDIYPLVRSQPRLPLNLYPPHPLCPGVDFLVRFVAKDIKRRVPRMEAEGAELLRQMLVYEPDSRITCAQALQQPYFQSVNPCTAMRVAGQRSAPSPP